MSTQGYAQHQITDYEKAVFDGLKTDWPNLACFRNANEKIGLPKEGENRVVFMGNSITIGWIEMHPDFLPVNLMSTGESAGKQPLRCS